MSSKFLHASVQCACLPATAALVVSTWLLLQPSIPTWVVVICGILGVCSLGIYPIMLELSVECTFPLDESVVTGLCYLSSAIQVCIPHVSIACGIADVALFLLYHFYSL